MEDPLTPAIGSSSAIQPEPKATEASQKQSQPPAYFLKKGNAPYCHTDDPKQILLGPSILLAKWDDASKRS